MLQKESKIRVLENFYALDSVFFGKPVQKIKSCCEALIEDYMTVKGAFMSLMIEMYGIIDHQPDTISEKIDTKSLRLLAKESAKIARHNAQKLVETDQGRADVKASLKEALEENSDLNVEDEVREAIRKKAFGLAIDNLLIGRSFSESKSIEKLNEWDGQIVEDAYKVLRDNLVESALFILEANELTK
jgi:hypothetical protein